MNPQNPEQKREAQLVIVVGLVALSYLFKIEILAKIALALGLIFVFVPYLANLITVGWFKLSEALGWFNSRVLLSVVFFIFLVPFAFLSRLFTKDVLGLKPSKDTTFGTRNHLYTKKDLENIW
jgi:hypothetical protein